MNADLNVSNNSKKFTHFKITKTNAATPTHKLPASSAFKSKHSSPNQMRSNRNIERNTSFTLLSPHRAKKGMLNKSNININADGKYIIDDNQMPA